MTEEHLKNIEKIFSDKIRLWSSIITLEFKAMQGYNDLYRRIRMGEIVEDDLYRDGEYFIVWTQLISLFDFFENGKLDKLKGDEKKKLVDIVERYRLNDESLEFEHLRLVYSLVRKLMYLNGFHDLSTGKGSGRDFLAPTVKW